MTNDSYHAAQIPFSLTFRKVSPDEGIRQTSACHRDFYPIARISVLKFSWNEYKQLIKFINKILILF